MDIMTKKIYKQNIIKINDKISFGKGDLIVIGGPCSIESKSHILTVSKELKKVGVNIIRGGSYKLRTSPDSFQGYGKEAIRWLVDAGKEVDLPVVTEIVDVRQVDDFEDVDIIQIGARNMQNFYLLREVGKLQKPVILKRGFASTYKELLYASEYIRKEGNEKIILCERGIRTFENYTRNTLDIAAVPALHELSEYPVIIDASHGTGRESLVEPVSLAGVAAGADGLLIEVHNEPNQALSDGVQAISTQKMKSIVEKSKKIRDIIINERY